MIEIIRYEDKYKEQLEVLLKEMSAELYGTTGTVNIDHFVNNHWAIYLAIEDGAVVGFTSFIVNTYFGLRPPTVGNTYLYVIPKKRNGRAMYHLSVQFCFVAEETNLPIETYVASEASRRALTRIEGRFLYDVYEYQPEDIAQGYSKLKKHIKD
jgi:hypothetical protein